MRYNSLSRVLESAFRREGVPTRILGGQRFFERVEVSTPAAPAAAEKTLFTLQLQEFDASAKAKVIKEVKSLLGLSLVESKKFVESAPKMMKENVTKEDAEKIIATMKDLGAKVTME